MLIQHDFRENPVKEEQDMYTFKREKGMWYIDLPWYLQHGWDKQDLRMVEGAHKFLNVISNGAKKIRLRISLQPQEEAGVLELVEHCLAPKGGAIYLFTSAKGHAHGTLFWICDLALFVFGDMPDRFYVQRC
jgi:hypothetical protein